MKCSLSPRNPVNRAQIIRGCALATPSLRDALALHDAPDHGGAGGGTGGGRTAPRVCNLAGDGGPELTDDLAKQAGADASQNVTYAGTFGPLGEDTTPGGFDTCHANMAGQELLGNQAKEKFGP
jgi:hypothetical protein